MKVTNGYSIGQVARLFGVTPRTVQNWDRNGLLEAKRTLRGQRYFSINAVNQYLCDHPLYDLPKTLRHGRALVLAEKPLYQHRMQNALQKFSDLAVIAPIRSGACFDFSVHGRSSVLSTDNNVMSAMAIWDSMGRDWDAKVRLLKRWTNDPKMQDLIGDWRNVIDLLDVDGYDQILLPSKCNLVFSTIAELVLDLKHRKNLAVWDWGTDYMNTRDIQAAIAGAQVRI